MNFYTASFVIPPEPRMPLTYEEKLKEAIERYGPDAGPLALQEVPALFETEIMYGVPFPHESLGNAYESGCAEPWTSHLVAALLIASNQRNVLETGSFTGYTSAWLALALERLGGGTFTAVDIDPERAATARARLAGLGLEKVNATVVTDDVLHFLTTVPDRSLGFVWVDDDHSKHHVEQEINALWKKMVPGGIIAGHDVFGSCDLQTIFKKYGGYAIDLPRLGPAGGIGVLQIPR